jgi:hypothetical protein
MASEIEPALRPAERRSRQGRTFAESFARQAGMPAGARHPAATTAAAAPAPAPSPHRSMPASAFLAQQIAQAMPELPASSHLQARTAIAAYRTAAGDDSTLLGPVRPAQLRL